MEHFMKEAFDAARNALAIGEVPVGCVLIYRNEIIATGGNYVNATKNATRHAEFVCIDEVLEYCRRNSLDFKEIFPDISVVVTVEPCVMCAAALFNLNVKEIYYGCVNDRFGGTTVLDVATTLNKSIPVYGGIRSDEAMDLLKEFYKGDNPSAPLSKKEKKTKKTSCIPLDVSHVLRNLYE